MLEIRTKEMWLVKLGSHPEIYPDFHVDAQEDELTAVEVAKEDLERDISIPVSLPNRGCGLIIG